MGLFSDETVRIFDLSACKVFDKDIYPETQKKLILEYVKQGLSGKDYIMSFGNTGAAQLKQYYLEGQSDYIDYLPDAYITGMSLSLDLILHEIEEYENTTVEIFDSVYGYLPIEDFGKFYLQNHYNYNISQDDTFIDNVHWKYVSTNPRTVKGETGVFNTYSYFIDIRLQSKSSSTTYKTISVPYSTYTGTYQGNEIQILLKYKIVATGDIRYASFVPDNVQRIDWIFNPKGTTSLNVKSILSDKNIPMLQQTTSSFDIFPITMFRNAYKNVTDYAKYPNDPVMTEKRYKSTSAIMNALGIDLDSLTDNICENPDIGYVVDSFLHIGISPTKHFETSSNAASEALYKQFEWIYKQLPLGSFSSANLPAAGLTYTAVFREDPYYSTITWTPSGIEEKEEVIGPLGTFTNIVDNSASGYKMLRIQSTTITDGDGYEQEVDRDLVYSTVSDADWKSIIFRFRHQSQKTLILKYQYSKTRTRTITLRNIEQMHLIKQGGESGTKIITPDNENFLVPLFVRVTDNLSFPVRTSLLAECIWLTFYTYQEYTVKWYQSDFFQFILQVIMTVITIWSMGAFSPVQTGVTAGMTLGQLLLKLLIGAALTIALKIIAKKIDSPLLAGILSAVTVVVGMYAGGFFDAFEWNLMTAVDLLAIPFTAIDMFIKTDLGNKTSALELEKTQFETQYEERMEEIKVIQEGWDNSIDTDWVVNYVKRSTNVNKEMSYTCYSLSPSLFYDMTINYYRDNNLLYLRYHDIFFANINQIGIIEV